MLRWGRQFAFTTALMGAVVFSTSARAADLTAAEKEHFDLAKKYLVQFQTNLKLARDAAGPGEDTPPASKAKLAAARLQTARQSAANVAARLEKLPSDDEEVKALQGDYDETMKAVEALNDRITGKNAKPKAESSKPSADAPAVDAPDTKEAKLEYRDEQALRIAQGNVDQVAGHADELEKTLADVKAAKDKAAISNETFRQAQTTAAEARRRAGFANEQFKKLPAGHSSVKAQAEALKAALARVDAAEKALAPFAKESMKQVDPSSYPDFQTDNDRLRELADTLAVGNIQSQRAAVAELVKQLPAMKEETARIEKKYGPLLGQRTSQSETLKQSNKRFAYSLQRFEEAIAKEKQSLPQQFDQDLERVAKMAEEAVKETKPLFFQGGIADNLRFAEEKLVLYEALDPAGAKAAAAKLAAAREDVKQKQLSLSGAIIEANALPPDRYNGPDKADLAKRATEALKKQRPKSGEVLTVRFPSDKWNREAKWRYENREWRKIDRSKLQAQVIVKRDDKVAEVHPINLWTDHMNNDAISAIPLYGEKEELGPDSLLLVAKVK